MDNSLFNKMRTTYVDMTTSSSKGIYLPKNLKKTVKVVKLTVSTKSIDVLSKRVDRISETSDSNSTIGLGHQSTRSDRQRSLDNMDVSHLLSTADEALAAPKQLCIKSQF